MLVALELRARCDGLGDLGLDLRVERLERSDERGELLVLVRLVPRLGRQPGHDPLGFFLQSMALLISGIEHALDAGNGVHPVSTLDIRKCLFNLWRHGLIISTQRVLVQRDRGSSGGGPPPGRRDTAASAASVEVLRAVYPDAGAL